jgi:putative pyoverdin transport system ATP-binding/permease protein
MFNVLLFYARASRVSVGLTVLIGLTAGLLNAGLMALITVRLTSPTDPALRFTLAFIGLAVLDLGASLASGLLSNRLSQHTSYDLRLRLGRKLLEVPLRQLEELGTHRTVSVLTEDVGSIVNAFIDLPMLCTHTAVLVGCLAYLGWLSLPMLATLVAFIVVAVVTIKGPERWARRHLRLAREERDRMGQHFEALTEGAKELKLHQGRREAFFSRMYQATAHAYRDHNLIYGRYFAGLNAWAQVLYFVIIGGIVFVAPTVLSGLDRRVLTAYAFTALYMRGHLVGVMSLAPLLSRAAVSLRKVEELGQLFTSDPPEAGRRAEPTSAWRAIELRRVVHRYEGEGQERSFVLGPLDLTLQPNELLFVVGGNGSGKTTLAKMLTGLYAPESGEVRLDGEPVAEAARDRYRQLFSAVFTNFHLFDELVGLNGHGETIWPRAQKYLELLRIDDKVTVDAAGRLSTTRLSHGQRKRLALLVAYMEDRPICVFDEWAAGQDPAFQKVFYLDLLPELKRAGKTVVVVTHDDRYFHVADRIVKLELGQIVGDLAGGDALAPLGSEARHVQ